jgi:hypothetical protein
MTHNPHLETDDYLMAVTLMIPDPQICENLLPGIDQMAKKFFPANNMISTMLMGQLLKNALLAADNLNINRKPCCCKQGNWNDSQYYYYVYDLAAGFKTVSEELNTLFACSIYLYGWFDKKEWIWRPFAEANMSAEQFQNFLNKVIKIEVA